MSWKGNPLSFYVGLYERGHQKSPLTTSTRFQICELALQMLMSEDQFYKQFNSFERAQLLATYQTRKEINWVQYEFPLKMPGSKG